MPFAVPEHRRALPYGTRMAVPRPPDRTLRYRIKTANLPNDLSNAFFSRSQIAHTKCFKSGPFIIVGLASDADRDNHMSPTVTENLKLLGFELVEGQAQISARTILARKIDDYLLKKTPEDLRAEIEAKNNVAIDDLRVIAKAHMLKIRFRTRQEAQTTTQKGMKLFSQIIPHYNTNIEQYLPVTQCYKCYKFTHRTNQCKESDLTCSKCAAKGHGYQNCQVTTLKCINCNGDHPAVSFRCQVKKNAQQQQNSTTHTTQTNNSYAKAATPSTPTPTAPPSPPTQNTTTTTTTTTDKQFLTDFIIKYSIEISGGDLQKQAEVMNTLLVQNNCPTISFPPNFFQQHQQHFQQTHEQHKQTQENTHTAKTSTLPPVHNSPVSEASSDDETGDLVIDDDTTTGEEAASGETQPLSPCSSPTTSNTTVTTLHGSTVVKRHLLPNPDTPHQRQTRNTSKKTVKI